MRRTCLSTAAFLLLAAIAMTLLTARTAAAATHSRRVTVNWVNTYWGPSGPVKVPEPDSAAGGIEALVSVGDNSFTIYKASATKTPGVFVIDNVPTGNYWLEAGGGVFWTDTSTFDAGRDYWGGEPPVTSTFNTPTFNFDILGIAADSNTDTFQFYPLPPSGSVSTTISPDSTSLVFSFQFFGNIDWTQIQDALLMQYQSATLDSLTFGVLGPELTESNLALTNSGPNTITGTLNPAALTSLNLNVSGSQWASLFNKVGPASATPQFSNLSLTAEPFVTGINAGVPPGTSITGISPISTTSPPVSGGGIELFATNPTLPILVDQNLGTLEYGDPFESTWTRPLTFSEQASIPIAIPNSNDTFNFNFMDGESVAPSNSPIVPVALPVQSPKIDGSSFYKAKTIDKTTPSLSWTAPTGTAPCGYAVGVYVLTTLNDEYIYEPVGSYSTAGNSVTLPPLAGGNTYIFTIATKVDGAANMQSSPFRSKLPTGFASVVSAPITISPSAAAPRINGDIEEWNWLVNQNSTKP